MCAQYWCISKLQHILWDCSKGGNGKMNIEEIKELIENLEKVSSYIKNN